MRTFVIFLLLTISNFAFAGAYPVNGGFVYNSTVETTAGGTTALVATSNQARIFEGSLFQILKFPNAQLLPDDWSYELINNSSSFITVRDYDSGEIASVSSGRIGKFQLKSKATQAGTWKYNVNASASDLSNFFTKSEFISSTSGSGDAGKPIKTNAAGQLDSSMLPGGGDGIQLDDLSATAPLSYDNTSGQFSIPVATDSDDGYLSSGDHATFSAKQDAGNYITGLSGDVAASGPGSVTATIQSNSVTNSKAAQMAAHTIKGNNSGSTANQSDLTIAQVATELDGYFVDSVGTINSQAKSANGAVMTSGGVLVFQDATPGFPGLVSDNAQTFTGAKTFTSNIKLEDPGAGTNKITMAVPTLASDFSFPLPASDGVSGDVLTKTSTGSRWASPGKAYWIGYFDSDCEWGKTSGFTTDWSDDGSCTFTEVKNKNMGTVSAGGSKRPEITWTSLYDGSVQVCVSFTYYNGAANNVTRWDIWDGTSFYSRVGGNGNSVHEPTTLCGVKETTVGATETWKIRGEAPSTGSAYINPAGANGGHVTYRINYL